MKNLTLSKKHFRILEILGVVVLLTTLFVSCQKKENLNHPFKTSNSFSTALSFAPPTTISHGLIAYWTFAKTTRDLSGYGHNGTAFSLTSSTDRTGHTVGAYLFDGSTSYITVPDAVPLRLNNTDFTITAWVNLSSYNSSNGSIIMSKRQSGVDPGWAWSITGLGTTPTGVSFFGPGGTGSDAMGAVSIPLSSWHMVTNVYNLTTQVIDIYIDGVLDTSVSGILSPNSSITAALYIGKDNPLASSGYFFNGSMSDIRIYNRAVTTTEITALYNAPTAPTLNLVAFWPLCNTAVDYSGDGHNGTSTNITAVPDRLGDTVGASHFDGSSSFISVPDKPGLRISTNFTLNAWVKLDSYNSSNGSIIMSKRQSGIDSGWAWSVTGYSTTPTGVLFYGPGGGSTNAIGSINIPTGSWHMVTSTYNSVTQNLSIYIDGVLDSVTGSIAPANASTAVALYIGKDTLTGIGLNHYFFNGSMSDIRIYNRVLTTTELQQLYNALD